MIRRNILIYFKDVQTVVFSVLTSIIVFLLYLLFLKANYVDSMNSNIGALEAILSKSDVERLVDGILLTGVVGSALLTVPFNCLTTIISDRERKVDYDILATPVKRWRIILSYFVASAFCSFVITSVILTAGFAIMMMNGAYHISAAMVAAAYGMVLLGSISSTAFFMIIMMFFKTSAASGSFFGILSAAGGFLIGAYIPISQFSTAVQTACNILPGSHITIVLRNIIMNGQLDYINDKAGGVDDGQFVEMVKKIFGFKAKLGGNTLGISEMLIYVVVAMVICIGAIVVIYSKNYKRK